MIEFVDKVIIALPDSRPHSGLGHILRTFNLLTKFYSTKNIYLITENPGWKDHVLNISCINYSQVDLLPGSLSDSDVLLIFDSYDCAKCASIYEKIVSLLGSSQIKVLSVCDTFNQARSMISLVPSTDLLFPNIITSQLRSDLDSLCAEHNCMIYHGYSYILLDKPTIDTPDVGILRASLDYQKPICLVAFGFSSFVFTSEFLAHCMNFLNYIIQEFPSTQFYLLGRNSLQLFIKLGMSQFISQYHQFLTKHSLIRMYDSSTFYFGSLGYSMWERAFRRLPSFVCPIAENQNSYVEIGKNLNILCSSYDVLENNFNFSDAIASMQHGTLNFKKSILKYSIL